MKSRAERLIPTVLLQILISFFAQYGVAAEIDRSFVTEVLSRSNCNLTDQFVDEFSAAMDRLGSINPSLTSRIRLESYARKLWLRCADIKESESIFYRFSDQTIYLRSGANADLRTPASFFHEFLHFVGVKVDYDAHNSSANLNIKEDHVYGCHFAVFPQVLPKEWQDLALKEAPESCSKAEFE
ncbi:MAG: hypothetical protein KF802_01045 [Bdellovibrionaceae bacterium]|nr:hypothetical protein [Pseudobdellovibrionaceae bacterium]MBX3034306.1 hypothetical protein [Pseudobdellovibrionaceae bacterium]